MSGAEQRRGQRREKTIATCFAPRSSNTTLYRVSHARRPKLFTRRASRGHSPVGAQGSKSVLYIFAFR
jgi:hypothetical protein